MRIIELRKITLIPFFAVDNGISIHFENIIQNLIEPDVHFNVNINRHRARIKHRNRYYYERIIPRFTANQFKEMFRMSNL